MKNVQVIDGARNSVFEIYSVSDQVFTRLFPEGTNISFVEDFPGDDPMWVDFYNNLVIKEEVAGIHGTLHHGEKSILLRYFPTRREKDAKKWRP